MAIFWHIYSDATDATVTNTYCEFDFSLYTILTFARTHVQNGNIWDSAIKPVTSDATDATVTNVTDTAKFIYATHMPGYTT